MANLSDITKFRSHANCNPDPKRTHNLSLDSSTRTLDRRVPERHVQTFVRVIMANLTLQLQCTIWVRVICGCPYQNFLPSGHFRPGPFTHRWDRCTETSRQRAVLGIWSNRAHAAVKTGWRLKSWTPPESPSGHFQSPDRVDSEIWSGEIKSARPERRMPGWIRPKVLDADKKRSH